MTDELPRPATGLVLTAVLVTSTLAIGLASADGLVNAILEDDFDDGAISDATFALVENGAETDTCGSVTEGDRALVFTSETTSTTTRADGGTADREARTAWLDTSNDGTIAFSFVDAGEAFGHEDRECQEPGDVVWLEYRTSEQDRWHAIAKHTNPLAAGSVPAAVELDVPIPEDAQTASTQFRIAQYVHDVTVDDAGEWAVDALEVRQVTSEDRDGDGVPDTREHELCHRDHTRDLLQGNFGECQETSSTPSGWDYVPAENMTIRSPERFQYGRDADGDGVPRQVNVSFTRFTVQPETGVTDGPTPVEPANLSPSGLAQPVHVTLEPDDENKSRPVEDTVCSRLNSATGIEQGRDDDGDGFPDEVEVAIGKVCVDTANPWPPEFRPVVTESHRTIDTDDSDPTVPGTDTVTTDPVGLSAAYSQDKDDDGFPGNITVYWQKVTVGADGPDRLSAPWSETTKLDPDDTDPSVPETDDLDHIDPYGDGDGNLVPDEIEDDYCSDFDDEGTTADGFCQTFVTTDFTPSEELQNTIGHLAREPQPVAVLVDDVQGVLR